MAKDLDAAAALARQYRYRFRIVTLDGQVIHPGGSLTGGSLVKNAGLISRTAEIEQLKQNLETRRDQERETMEQWNQAQAKTIQAAAKAEQIRAQIAEAQEYRVEQNSQWSRVRSDWEILQHQRRELEQEYQLTAARREFGGCQTAGSSPTGNFRRTNFSSAAGIGKVKRKPGGKQSTGRAALPFASGNSVGFVYPQKKTRKFYQPLWENWSVSSRFAISEFVRYSRKNPQWSKTIRY